jgi:hypothetical protein
METLKYINFSRRILDKGVKKFSVERFYGLKEKPRTVGSIT